MRIAMYSDQFLPFLSGVTTSITILVNNLAKAGHEIYLQVPNSDTPVDLSQFHPKVQIQFTRAIPLKIYPELRLGTGFPFSIGRVQDFHPDVIHVHTPLLFGAEGALTAHRLKIPIVQTFHGYYMDPYAVKSVGISNPRLAELVQKGGWQYHRATSRLYHATIAPTEFVAKDLKQHKTPGEIVVCPNMLDSTTYEKKPLDKEKKDHLTLLFVGRLSSEKRVDLILKLLAQLKENGHSFRLIIIGDGPQRSELFAQSFSLGVSDLITWVGKVAHEKLLRERLYHRGDIFITFSRFETFGYTSLEAMAQGLPVFALASRANKEVIAQPETLLPDYQDDKQAVSSMTQKLLKLQKRDLQALQKNAYEHAWKYHPEKVVPIYEKMYQNTIKTYKALQK